MCEPLLFRSRPEVVEVVRLDSRNAADLCAWVADAGGAAHLDDAGQLVLGTGLTEQLPMPGAIVVRDGAGCFRAMSTAELEAHFEALGPLALT